MDLVKALSSQYMKEELPEMRVGDTVRVHVSSLIDFEVILIVLLLPVVPPPLRYAPSSSPLSLTWSGL